MAIIYLNINIGDLLKIGDRLDEAAERAVREAQVGLMAATDAHIRQQAKIKLKSRREQFENALRIQPVGNDTFVVVLDAQARWIDDGLPPHEMIEQLLKSPKAKRAKDGSRYLSVPFHHGPGKGATNATKGQLDLTAAVKAAMAKRNMPFAKIETNPNGSPKYGYVGGFNANTPIKTQEGPWQGRGAIGQPRQGHTGIPFLQGVRIYQRPLPTTDGKPKTGRFIMTFRTVSDKQKGQGKWQHPGLAPTLLIEESVEWAKKEWDNHVASKLVDLVITQIS